MEVLKKNEGYLYFISNKYKLSVLIRRNMKIIVDSDACPVKEIIIKVAKKYDIETIFVCSLSHYSNCCETHNIKTIYVDDVFQSADLAIINRADVGDIVITGDFGLAAMALSKGAHALSFDGRIYDDRQIDDLLNIRHHKLKLLRSGGRNKGPKKRSKEDDDLFLSSLEALIVANMKR